MIVCIPLPLLLSHVTATMDTLIALGVKESMGNFSIYKLKGIFQGHIAE